MAELTPEAVERMISQVATANAHLVDIRSRLGSIEQSQSEHREEFAGLKKSVEFWLGNGREGEIKTIQREVEKNSKFRTQFMTVLKVATWVAGTLVASGGLAMLRH